MKYNGLRRDLNCIEVRKPSYPLSLGERVLRMFSSLGYSAKTIYGAPLSQTPVEKTHTAHSHVHYLKLLSISVPQTRAGMVPFGSVGVGLLWSPNSSTTARLKRFFFWRVRLWQARLWEVRL
jgi:DNA mismatch repair protein MutH